MKGEEWKILVVPEGVHWGCRGAYDPDTLFIYIKITKVNKIYPILKPIKR